MHCDYRATGLNRATFMLQSVQMYGSHADVLAHARTELYRIQRVEPRATLVKQV